MVMTDRKKIVLAILEKMGGYVSAICMQAHPRQGATDVCPLIPVSNITMEEVVEYAHKLGKRLGDEPCPW